MHRQKPKGLKHLVPMPPAQPSSNQEKGPEKHQDLAKASKDNTILSISSSTSDLGITLSSSIRASDARSAFPSEADPADVSGQTTEPTDLGTSSVVPPEQTITTLPQGKVPITESLSMIL